MPATDSPRRPDFGLYADADTDDDDDLPGNESDEIDLDGPDDLAETGLDLSEAGDLDADNVTADEESSRVVQAPD